MPSPSDFNSFSLSAHILHKYSPRNLINVWMNTAVLRSQYEKKKSNFAIATIWLEWEKSRWENLVRYLHFYSQLKSKANCARSTRSILREIWFSDDDGGEIGDEQRVDPTAMARRINAMTDDWSFDCQTWTTKNDSLGFVQNWTKMRFFVLFSI